MCGDAYPLGKCECVFFCFSRFCGRSLVIVISVDGLARLLKAKGDYDSAEPLYQRALAIAEAGG